MTSSHKLISPEHQETPPPECTHGTMFRGRVHLTQHRCGYRFSIDAVLLSHFVSSCSPTEILDVGTGCGVVPLLLADLWEQRGYTPFMTAVERQPDLAVLAQQNVKANARQSQMKVIKADIRTWRPQTQWHIITCNPPFYPKQSGNISPNPERAAARHELHGSLNEIVAVAASLLHTEGQLSMVYPASFLTRLQAALQAAQLTLTRQRFVHPHENAPPKLALVTASPSTSPLQQEAPLYLYRTMKHANYTPEAEAIFAGSPPKPRNIPLF